METVDSQGATVLIIAAMSDWLDWFVWTPTTMWMVGKLALLALVVFVCGLFGIELVERFPSRSDTIENDPERR